MRKGVLLAAVSLVVGVGLLTGCAAASESETTTPSITASTPDDGVPVLDLTQPLDSPAMVVPLGKELRVLADGFEPNGEVRVVVGSDQSSTILASVRADDNGQVSVVVSLPDSLDAGVNTMEVNAFTPDGLRTQRRLITGQ